MKVKLKCEDCGEREGIINFSDNPFMSLTHGWASKNICRQCYIKRIEKGLKDTKDNLEEQKKLLKKENKK